MEEAKLEAGVGGCGSKIEVRDRGVVGSWAEAKAKQRRRQRQTAKAEVGVRGLMAAGVWRLGYCQGYSGCAE